MKNVSRVKGLSFVIIALLLCMIFAPSTHAVAVESSDILYVGGVGSSNYSYIQNAVDAAKPGDTVYVYSGTYYENIIIVKPINLIGENKNTTIVDGTLNASVVYILADGVYITGFTLQNGSRADYKNAGIEIHSLNNRIIGNIIKNNRVGVHPLWAGALDNEGNNTFMDNIVIDNDKDAFCIHSSHNIIRHNHIEGNGGGIWLQINANKNKIEQNNFINNTYNAAFYKAMFNRWDSNYWDDWIGLKGPLFKLFPKAIVKKTIFMFKFTDIPWFNFDRHPRSIPFTIT